MDIVTIIMNVLALILAVIFAVLLYNWKSKTVSKLSGWAWACTTFIGIMVFFNAIGGVVNYFDKKQDEQAFATLEMRMKESGNPDEDSWSNMHVTINNSKIGKNRGSSVYVGNFNKETTFTGKVFLEFLKDSEVVYSHTSKEFTIHPGEKKSVSGFSFNRRKFDSYRWEWIGELK